MDEYDGAANKAYLEFEELDADKVANLFKEIFESSLKGNKYI